ncbi:MAG: hypothetical protein AAB656_02635 [Patescibacteria group bacterium]
MKKTAIFFATLGIFLLASPVLAEDTVAIRSPKPRLEQAKARVCEAKKGSITKRVDQLLARSEKMVKNFTDIAQRVMDYYTNKVLPDKTVSNYEELVAAITDKKAVVDAALDDAKSKASTFSCDSESPKAQLTEYRLAMQKVISALKEYRTAVRNLIVAVKSEK